MILSQIAFALGARGGLARILMPSAMNTASKEPVNWPARSLIRNLSEVARWHRSIRTLRAACVVHEPSGLAVMPARWTRRVPGHEQSMGSQRDGAAALSWGRATSLVQRGRA